jgi:hypothetical protein
MIGPHLEKHRKVLFPIKYGYKVLDVYGGTSIFKNMTERQNAQLEEYYQIFIEELEENPGAQRLYSITSENCNCDYLVQFNYKTVAENKYQLEDRTN